MAFHNSMQSAINEQTEASGFKFISIRSAIGEEQRMKKKYEEKTVVKR